jgi:hypothetical protein
LLLVLLVVLVLLGVGGWLAFAPETIRQGMTRDEVEAILGPPDGRMLADNLIAGNVILVWKDRWVIEFDAANRVQEASQPPTIVSNLRGLLGL